MGQAANPKPLINACNATQIKSYLSWTTSFTNTLHSNGVASLYACVNWFIYDICVYISEQEVLLIEEDRNGADHQDGDMSCSLIQKFQIDNKTREQAVSSAALLLHARSFSLCFSLLIYRPFLLLNYLFGLVR